ncbi:MAG TPA: 16S rRNA (guanine(527)-N(7))-methyltransferase RsmG [Mycobacteriales bacterium]|nr:16S rRNA (guanine(527)-N(7))-methyltransferase RsmG [Mycobacteriales bacterium]
MSVLLDPSPAAAAEVFGSALPRLEAYAALLAGPGTERGLLGPREVPRLWERHLLNCAGLSSLVEDGQVVLDLGSGAGLPGIVLALQRPEVQVVLVESLQRRAQFLAECVEALGLRNTLVRRSRAEELHGKLEVDVVTARAVAPVDRLAAWSLPLLHPGGRLLAVKGEQAQAELEVAGPALARLGAVSSSVVEVGSGELGTHARIVVVEAGRLAPQGNRPRPQRRPGR